MMIVKFDPHVTTLCFFVGNSYCSFVTVESSSENH